MVSLRQEERGRICWISRGSALTQTGKAAPPGMQNSLQGPRFLCNMVLHYKTNSSHKFLFLLFPCRNSVLDSPVAGNAQGDTWTLLSTPSSSALGCTALHRQQSDSYGQTSPVPKQLKNQKKAVTRSAKAVFIHKTHF